MKSFIAAAMAVAMIGILDARPASAARESWRVPCNGPEVVCGEVKRSATANVSDVQKPKKVKKTASKAKKTASKAKKPAKVAKSYDNDYVAPKKKKKSYSANSGGGSSYSLSGKASYYWQPQRVASGGWFNPNAMTAAHKTLPFGTRVRVTNQNNGKSVTVVINDRGPYIAGRIIDLSKAAAYAISMQGSGVVPVKVAVLGK
jgi:rare lipoprotein A